MTIPQLVLPLLLATSPPPDTLVYPMEGVTVTGTRVPETLLRVPAAVTVVPRYRLEETRGLSLKDALDYVPGVFVQSRAGGTDVRVTIRGFGARGNGDRSNAGNMRGIRILQDGMPLTEPDGRTSLDFVDLGTTQSVEVLRSNGSAMYGNASGGVVNLRTFIPVTSPFLELRERAGAFGYHREQGIGGFVIGSTTGTLSLLNSTYDGWREHSRSWSTQAQARLKSPLDDRTNLGILVDAVTDLNFFSGALSQAEYDSLRTQADPRYVTRNERRRNKIGRLSLTLDRAMTAGQDLAFTLFAEPKVLQRSERNRFRDFTRYHLGGSATYTARTPLGAGTEGTWSAGVDDAYQDGAILFYNLVTPGGTRSDVLFANRREGTNAAGGFVQGEVRHGGWSVRAAARYDAIQFIAEDFMDPSLDTTRTFTRLTPKGSLAYTKGTHTVYASLGGGVETPAFNEIDPPPPFDTLTALNPFLDPMRSTTYEVGARGDFAVGGGTRGRVQYEAAVYQIDVHHEVVPFDGGAYFLTAGQSRRRGVEAALSWSPIERLLLSSSATFSDNKYLDYTNELGTFEDNQVPGLPRVIASGQARYEIGGGVEAEAVVQHVGRYYANDANDPDQVAPAYTILNGTIGVTRSTPWGAVRFFVTGNNLTDTKYVSSVFINSASQDAYGLFRYIEPGLPRNVTVGATLRL